MAYLRSHYGAHGILVDLVSRTCYTMSQWWLSRLIQSRPIQFEDRIIALPRVAAPIAFGSHWMINTLISMINTNYNHQARWKGLIWFISLKLILAEYRNSLPNRPWYIWMFHLNCDHKPETCVIGRFFKDIWFYHQSEKLPSTVRIYNSVWK